MSDSGRVLVAGLGSSHGDDRAGWFVAERLADQFRTHPRIDVRRAMIPLDVLDWLEGIDILHVCDACATTRRLSKLHRFRWNAGQMIDSDIPHAVGIGSFNREPSGPREQRPAGWIPTRGALPTRLNKCAVLNRGWYKSTDSDVNAALKSLGGRGSHDFGLPDVLRLAEKTGLLPKQVIIWAIEGNCFQPEDVMSDETQVTVRQVVNELIKELSMFHSGGETTLH
ncbi:MAG: hypothetical protein H7Z17_10520 [Fuerstia sp.]|nr:hypothetical protein [Fuerstiella sp.]